MYILSSHLNLSPSLPTIAAVYIDPWENKVYVLLPLFQSSISFRKIFRPLLSSFPEQVGSSSHSANCLITGCKSGDSWWEKERERDVREKTSSDKLRGKVIQRRGIERLLNLPRSLNSSGFRVHWSVLVVRSILMRDPFKNFCPNIIILHVMFVT